MASKSVKRFREVLAGHGLPDTIVELDVPARTADEAAAALSCSTGQIVKSLILADEQGATLLVLAAGDRRVDLARVAACHGSEVQMADAARVRTAAGYAIGGVPPFGHAQVMPVLIDASLERWHTVWAAAGTPTHVFSLAVEQLIGVTRGRVVEVV